jgi:hypothetical protein
VSKTFDMSEFELGGSDEGEVIEVGSEGERRPITA